MRNILIIFILLLSGCATTTSKEMQSVILDNKTKDIIVLPNDEDMQPCEAWTPLNIKNIKELKPYLAENSGKLALCSEHKQNLVEWIKRNIK